MSKYNALWEYLPKNGEQDIVLSFDEIKIITGFDIDHSFLNYKKEAGKYGYEVGKISIKKRQVIFHKTGNTDIDVAETVAIMTTLDIL